MWEWIYLIWPNQCMKVARKPVTSIQMYSRFREESSKIELKTMVNENVINVLFIAHIYHSGSSITWLYMKRSYQDGSSKFCFLAQIIPISNQRVFLWEQPFYFWFVCLFSSLIEF